MVICHHLPRHLIQICTIFLRNLVFFLIPSLNLPSSLFLWLFGVWCDTVHQLVVTALSPLSLPLHMGPLCLCPSSSRGFSSRRCVPALVHLGSHPLSSSQCLDTTQQFKLAFCTEHWELPASLDSIRMWMALLSTLGHLQLPSVCKVYSNSGAGLCISPCWILQDFCLPSPQVSQGPSGLEFWHSACQSLPQIYS